MKTTLPPNNKTPRYINLTGSLVTLKSSLTPDCRHFEASPPMFTGRARDDDSGRWTWRIAVAFLLVNVAIVALYLIFNR